MVASCVRSVGSLHFFVFVFVFPFLFPISSDDSISSPRLSLSSPPRLSLPLSLSHLFHPVHSFVHSFSLSSSLSPGVSL